MISQSFSALWCRYATLPPGAPSASTAAQRPLEYNPRVQPLAALYVGLTASRLGLYFLHVLLAPLFVAIKAGNSHPDLFSDHIFLGTQDMPLHALCCCSLAVTAGLRQLYG